MKKCVLRTVLLFIVFVLVGSSPACQTANETRRRQADDAAITTAVKARLAADVSLDAFRNIEVDTTDGVVTLSGQVTNEEERKAAEELARDIQGVTKVNNQLQVANPPL